MTSESLGPVPSTPPGEPYACRQCGNALEVAANFCALCGAPALGESAPDPLIGRVVADRYRIQQLVGRGGMGVVYKCEHTRMGKLMAIKLLHGDLARDAEVQRRFRREAQAASRLSHPCTVGIFDFGTSDGLMYLVMEYVAGDDLGKVLRVSGHLPPERVAALAAQACGSLAEAHDNGIVHRDLKPENLLISRTREGKDLVKLLDFGLAKLREGEDRNEITSSGTLVGTPYYMAPEVIRGHAMDHRVDIYALGAVLYRAITGVPPYTGTSPVAVLTRALTEDLVPPSRRRPEFGIPSVLDAIVLRCMAKAPEDRYARIEEVREALLEYLGSAGISDSWLTDSRLSRASATPGGERRSGAGTTGKQAVATRNDVEAFERSLRRGRYAAWSALALLGGLALGSGIFLWRQNAQARTRPHDAEVEPNQTLESATLIAPGRDVRGQIGQRMAPERGDVDVFRLGTLPPGPSRLRAVVTGQPNIDLVVELVRGGRASAVFVADDAQEGGREVIAGFRVGDDPDEREYYVSVHERVRSGMRPLESISDFYTLNYTLAPIVPGVEVEPDDREEIAAPLTPGVPVEGLRGYLEARDDVDYWCFTALPRPVRLTLTPPDGLDVELVVHPRDGSAERVVDAAPAGRAEGAVVQPTANAQPPCVIVRGSRAHPIPSGNGDAEYILRAEAQ